MSLTNHTTTMVLHSMQLKLKKDFYLPNHTYKH